MSSLAQSLVCLYRISLAAAPFPLPSLRYLPTVSSPYNFTTEDTRKLASHQRIIQTGDPSCCTFRRHCTALLRTARQSTSPVAGHGHIQRTKDPIRRCHTPGCCISWTAQLSYLMRKLPPRTELQAPCRVAMLRPVASNTAARIPMQLPAILAPPHPQLLTRLWLRVRAQVPVPVRAMGMRPASSCTRCHGTACCVCTSSCRPFSCHDPWGECARVCNDPPASVPRLRSTCLVSVRCCPMVSPHRR